MTDFDSLLSRRSFVGKWAAAATGVSLASGVGRAGARTPSPDRIRSIVTAMFAAYETGEADRILPFLTDDIMFTDPTFAIRVEGSEAVRAALARLRPRWEARRFRLTNTVVTADQAAVQVVASGKFRARAEDGVEWKSFEVDGATFFRFRGERIFRWTDYYDANGFHKQVGLEHF
jgi:steroid delta-isomerase-like uncharacterized protein